MHTYEAWLIYNGSLQTQKFEEIHEWYRRTAETKGIHLELVKNNELFSTIEENNTVIKASRTLKRSDFVLFLDKDIRLAKQLEIGGYRLFNSAAAIEACDDKILMHQKLANHGMRMPKTIFAPLAFTDTGEQSEIDNFLDRIELELGYPLVIKEAYGSFGEQVYLIQNRQDLAQKYNQLRRIPHLYQEFIKASTGKDARLHVVGDKVVAAMMRKSETDFRANVTSGGKMQPFEPPKAFVDLAIGASHLIGTDFSGVDVLFGDNGEPIICEINSNAHIKNIYDCTGIDVTVHIFDYIVKELSR